MSRHRAKGGLDLGRRLQLETKPAANHYRQSLPHGGIRRLISPWLKPRASRRLPVSCGPAGSSASENAVGLLHGAGAAPDSVGHQVLLDLPGVHLRLVDLPLDLLRLDQLPGDVLAERRTHQLVRTQGARGRRERARQFLAWRGLLRGPKTEDMLLTALATVAGSLRLVTLDKRKSTRRRGWFRVQTSAHHPCGVADSWSRVVESTDSAGKPSR